ncbi:porin [Colwellia psychrerythraea]|uniref:Porin domain-containing protein n=1 Tax=Colwellia psychrerythraea TaxID=28229 RepID=A0A099L472_COLPS|nr:porin [Colwellia psychrerythraea]KGJ97621.1 hypothetical protein GAB14E_1210 [Colwellia psychrerythraea]
MKHKIKILSLFSALVVSSVQAEIVFNGFANIVAGATTSSDETLYGFDDKFDFKNGSLFALQATSELGDGLGVTAQIISRGSNEWSPEFEWAYVSYDATDELRLLVGRQRVPFYMYSDFIDVSYAYPWITPPEGVYSVPFDSFDGLGAIYSTSFGEFDTTVQVLYGANNDDLAALADAPAAFEDLMGLSVTINREWLTLRAGYIQTNMNIYLGDPNENPLYTGWTAFGYPEVASNFVIEDDTGDFIELGFQVDYENVVLIGEYTSLTLDSTPIADADSYYVMAGYRFDNIMVHVTYGVDDDSKDPLTTGIQPDSPQLAGLIAGTNIFTNSLTEEQSYYTMGLRWDFHDSAAIKFEYTSFSDDLDSTNDSGLFRTAIVTVF